MFSACKIGFFGPNCTVPCTYPSFGKECQSECNCPAALCNHTYGCIEDKVLNVTIDGPSTKISKDNTEATRMPIVRTSDEKPSKSLDFPLSVLYIICSFVGIFAISCCIFAATYLYKHCIKQVTIAEGKGDGNISNVRVGYSSLGVEFHQHEEHSGDPAYLEPVSSYVSQYDEIMDRNEIDESSWAVDENEKN